MLQIQLYYDPKNLPIPFKNWDHAVQFQNSKYNSSDEITIFVFWRQLDLQNTFFMTVS